jgi:hypothetical protein
MNHNTTETIRTQNCYNINRSRPYQTQSPWTWMQQEDFHSGTEPKRKNAEGITNAAIAAKWDISPHDALRRNQTNTDEYTEQQSLHMKKGNRRSSREKRHLGSRSQW